MSVINPYLDAVESLKSLKMTEAILPISKKKCYVTSMLVGEELNIKTSKAGPGILDREIIRILHKYTTFVEEERNFKPTLDEFTEMLSYHDKSSLLWALYNATYDVISQERKIFCESCKSEFNERILADDLIHEDTYTFWEEDLPFNEYGHLIEITFGDINFSFLTKLPSIKDSNILMGRISVGELQKNMDDIGELFKRSQFMALVTKAIRFQGKKLNPVETSNLQEILISCEKFPEVLFDQLFKQYNDKFDKYSPKYYKNVKCSHCDFEFKYNVDIQTEFFRRRLLGGE